MPTLLVSVFILFCSSPSLDSLTYFIFAVAMPSVGENTCARVSHFYGHTKWNLLFCQSWDRRSDGCVVLLILNSIITIPCNNYDLLFLSRPLAVIKETSSLQIFT